MQLTIEPVTIHNREKVLSLSVADYQRGFVESPGECLDEARELSLWNPVAVCVDGEVVGFAMYGRFPHEGENGRVWLDRLLIDGRYQGRGYGRAAIASLRERLAAQYNCREIYLSCYPENTAAIGLYERLGFSFNGEKDINGEDVMVLKMSG